MIIDFDVKSDRELLILVCQSLNQVVDRIGKLDERLQKQDARLVRLVRLETRLCSSWRPNQPF